MDSEFASTFEENLRLNPFLSDALASLGSHIKNKDNLLRTSPGRIPIDIVEVILDFLLGYRRALKICSLVHRAWTAPCRARLFSTMIIRPDTNVQLMVNQLKTVSDTYTRELRVEGIVRSQMYVRHVKDKISYAYLATLSQLLTMGVHTLTISRSNLFFYDDIYSMDTGKHLYQAEMEAARSFLQKVQTLRFDLTEWLLYDQFQMHVADCPNVTRLVLFSGQPMQGPSIRGVSLRPDAVKSTPLPKLKHLALVNLGLRFRHRDGASRMLDVLQWLVSSSKNSCLETLTCVNSDVFMARAWEKFIGSSGKNLREIHVSFDFGDEIYVYFGGSPAEWFPAQAAQAWSLPVLREIEILANRQSVISAARLLQALETPELETIRLRLHLDKDWDVPTRSRVQDIAAALRRFPSLRHVFIHTSEENTNLKRMFAEVERRGTFIVHFDKGPFNMDPFADADLHSAPPRSPNPSGESVVPLYMA